MNKIKISVFNKWKREALRPAMKSSSARLST